MRTDLHRGLGLASTSPEQASDSYDLLATWVGPGDGNGKVHALQWVKGGDGIITDYPDRLRAVLRGRS